MNTIGRTASYSRKTNETSVNIDIDLDGSGICEINTGIGFLDHMLDQFGNHGLFDLKISATGDLHIDNHHTVEDVGLALGKAFSNALGDKKGLVRMANASVPMDDSLASTFVDFSGRPYCVFQCNWVAEMIGNLPTSLMEHFWSSFSITAGCTLHIHVLYGKDNHHMAEAIFKSAARAMMLATRIEPRRVGNIPSTKGSIQTNSGSL